MDFSLKSPIVTGNVVSGHIARKVNVTKKSRHKHLDELHIYSNNRLVSIISVTTDGTTIIGTTGDSVHQRIIVD